MAIMRIARAIGLAALIGGCNRAPAGPPAGQGMPPTPVVLAAAHPAPIEDASEYVASLKSLRSTTVQPQIDGQITKILVVAGDRVRQGAQLMEIDARPPAQPEWAASPAPPVGPQARDCSRR